jgi:hypothetical protein
MTDLELKNLGESAAVAGEDIMVVGDSISRNFMVRLIHLMRGQQVGHGSVLPGVSLCTHSQWIRHARALAACPVVGVSVRLVAPRSGGIRV